MCDGYAHFSVAETYGALTSVDMYRRSEPQFAGLVKRTQSPVVSTSIFCDERAFRVGADGAVLDVHVYTADSPEAPGALVCYRPADGE